MLKENNLLNSTYNNTLLYFERMSIETAHNIDCQLTHRAWEYTTPWSPVFSCTPCVPLSGPDSSPLHSQWYTRLSPSWSLGRHSTALASSCREYEREKDCDVDMIRYMCVEWILVRDPSPVNQWILLSTSLRAIVCATGGIPSTVGDKLKTSSLHVIYERGLVFS